MYVCSHVHLSKYLCIYTHMIVWYVCTYIYIHMYACMYVCMHACMHVHICIHMYMYVSACIYVCVYIYKHVFMNVWDLVCWHPLIPGKANKSNVQQSLRLANCRGTIVGISFFLFPSCRVPHRLFGLHPLRKALISRSRPRVKLLLLIGGLHWLIDWVGEWLLDGWIDRLIDW